MGLNASLCVLSVSDPTRGEGWSHFNDLICADFDLKSATCIEEFNLIIQSPMGEDIAVVILDQNMSCDAVRDCVKAIEDQFETKNVPVFLITDMSMCDAESIAQNTGVKRLLDLSVTVPALRTHIGVAMEEFRNLVQLRRELENRSSAIGQIVSGQFQFKTREEARNLATMLSIACPKPVEVVVGLTELMINAVEHGNLEIGHVEKGHLIETGMLGTEVAKRLARGPYANRVVNVHFMRDGGCYEFRIEDEGPGFDFMAYLGKAATPSNKKHGRGIHMARGCFYNIRYEGRGNVVYVGGCII